MASQTCGFLSLDNVAPPHRLDATTEVVRTFAPAREGVERDRWAGSAVPLESGLQRVRWDLHPDPAATLPGVIPQGAHTMACCTKARAPA
ncbi:MAG: hypothetical protein OXG11_10240 [Chloroflexi bacterium]|nr:hypothetical protein [Chloroflexota bacterium]